MKAQWIVSILVGVLGLSGCLEANKINQDETPPAQTQPYKASFSLPNAALTQLSLQAEQLEIQVFKVNDGSLDAEAGAAYSFPLSATGVYTLDDLPLGEVELRVTLLDADKTVIATGMLRTVLNPELQSLPAVPLEAKKPEAVALDLRLSLNLQNFPNTTESTTAEPNNVRAVFKNYGCQGCHSSGARPLGGLDLQSFPYKSKRDESLPQTLQRIINSLSGSEGVPKMPPGNKQVKDEDKAALVQFLETVRTASSQENKNAVKDVRLSLLLGGSSRLETSLSLRDGSYVLAEPLLLKPNTRYTYTLTVWGSDDNKLYELRDASLEVPLDGQLQWTVDVPFPTATTTDILPEL